MRNKIFYSIILVAFSAGYLVAQTWQSYTTENSGLPDNFIRSIAVAQDSAVWVATDSGLAVFKNDTWKVFNTGNGLSGNQLKFISFLQGIPPRLWVGTNYGVTILSINSAIDIIDYEYINQANDSILSNTVLAIELDTLASSWIGTDKGLSIITDSGIYNFNEENGLENSYVNTLELMPDNWVHVGTAGGGVSRLKYNGIDAVTSASRIIAKWSGLASDSVFDAYITDDTLRWYATTQGVSTHHGVDTKDINNWWIYNTYTSNIIDNYVRSIIRDRDGNMWFGTRKGISELSTDKSTWQSYTEADGLVSNNIFDMKIDKENNFWIATDSGLSKLTITTSAIAEYNQSQPESFDMQPAYPNPFNMSTTLKFQLHKLSSIKISFYDINGRLVNTILNSKLMPGSYKINWNGKNAAGNYVTSGVYFAVISSSSQKSFLKLVLVK
jgi:ligand-binding sensor domain-containing protein